MNAPLPPGAAAMACLRISEIIPSHSNPRKHFDDDYIAELAESIKSHGVIQPITVRPIPENVLACFKRNNHTKPIILAHPPIYEIVVGECRWRAAKLAGLVDIPGFWRELDDKQVLEIQVIENLQRRDVHPIEEAEGYERLMHDHGYKAEEIAAKIGKSRAYVYARLKLTALGNLAREAFYAGKLDASTALLIARIPGDKLQKKAIDKVTNGYDGNSLSYRDTKYYIHNEFTISLKQATFSPADAMLLPVAGSCTDCPKRSGNSPEICADLDDADVCTDTSCFEQKRMARRDQLIANAEKRKIPVLIGDAGRDAFHSGDYVELDDVAEGDDQDRTYREILGDKAPVSALIEFGFGEHHKRIFEVAEATAIEKALKKAGWKAAENSDGTNQNSISGDDDRRARLNAEATEREAKREAVEAENEYRKALSTAVIGRIKTQANEGAISLNTDELLALMAAAWLRFDFTFNDELDVGRLGRFGITVPVEPLAEGQDDYDDGEQLEKVAALVIKWPVGTALAFLFDVMTSEETNCNIWNFDPAVDLPHTLLALAKLVGFDPETLRNSAKPASTPSPAAQAEGKAPTEAAPAKSESPKKSAAKKSKAKSKADPAPAAPANEPAAPVKTAEPTERMPWPFPTGATA